MAILAVRLSRDRCLRHVFAVGQIPRFPQCQQAVHGGCDAGGPGVLRALEIERINPLERPERRVTVSCEAAEEFHVGNHVTSKPATRVPLTDCSRPEPGFDSPPLLRIWLTSMMRKENRQ